jgi:predicted DNA binding protein
MTATGGTQHVVGELSVESDLRALMDTLTAAFPATELVTKRERERPAETTSAFRSSLREELTDKQAAVLQAAYHAGYFEWPRGSTAEELADAIGITSPTLHNHLRRAEQKLLTEFFAGEDSPLRETPWSD